MGVSDTSLGLYVHVPFCERVCPYCDFAVVAARPLARQQEQAYLDALLAELASRRDDFAGLKLESVYLGGGTPSLLHPDSVARIVSAAKDAFPADRPEISLEVNPSTLERSRLPGFRDAGVNRVSLGVQSFADPILKRLGRAHRAHEARQTLAACRDTGFASISLDLIFAAPGQTHEGFAADLEEALAFAPEHISIYGLTVEPDTPFATAAERGQLDLPGEEETARMYEHAIQSIEAAGLRHYEISSFARPGHESLHNQRYWQRLPVLGLGMAAWSTEPRSEVHPFGARRSNLRSLDAYLQKVSSGQSAASALEKLDAATARGEAMFLALRTREGVDLASFAAEFGDAPKRFFGAELEELVSAQLLVADPSGRLRLTRRGQLISDSVFERFVALPTR